MYIYLPAINVKNFINIKSSFIIKKIISVNIEYRENLNMLQVHSYK